MLVNVFNSENSAPLVIESIIKTGSYHPGPKSGRIENPAEWTAEKIATRAASISSDKGPAGNFED
jgi:fructose-bisphosphate aldolase class II